jgi:serine protease SohB
MDATLPILILLVLVLVFIVTSFWFLSRFKKTFGELEIEVLNEKWNSWKWALKSIQLSKRSFRSELKKIKKKTKAIARENQKSLFYLNFEGDLRASEICNLRQEITAVLTAADPDNDEVFITVTSAGGSVQDYGLAASQLQRITNKRLNLTVSVDTVAASGGYLMACVANRIIASPFAIIGSIGVVAQFPNFHRLLKKWDIDYKEYTAGEFKRTVTLLGEIQPKGEQKFLEQLEHTHQFFKKYVQQHRPHVDVTRLATGEYWYGQKALELGLVDEILTSDDFLMNYAEKGYQIISIRYKVKKPWSQRLSDGLVESLEHKILSWLSRKI